MGVSAASVLCELDTGPRRCGLLSRCVGIGRKCLVDSVGVRVDCRLLFVGGR